MRFLVVGIAVLSLGCQGPAIHSMARTARLADMRFADNYKVAAAMCLGVSADWSEYDECMASWETAYGAIRVLIATSLALDVARGRKEFREAGCRWYRALAVVDATSPVELPSVKAGLESRWGRRCGG